jgi:hypothetical protein
VAKQPKLEVQVGADAGGLGKGLDDAANKLNLFGNVSQRQVAKFERIGFIRGAAQSAVSSMVSLAAQGTFTAGEVAGGISSVLSTVPNVYAQAGAAALGVLGAAIDVLNARQEAINQHANKAWGSFVSGARSAAQAVADVRIDSLTQGLTQLRGGMQLVSNLGEFAQQAGGFGGLAGLGGLGSVESFREGGINRIVADAQAAQDLVRQAAADPRMRNLQRQIATERAVGGVQDTAQTAGFQAAQASLQMEMLQSGRTMEEATAAAQGLAAAQALAAQTGITVAQAQERLGLAALDSFEAQRRAALLRGGVQLQQQTRTPQEVMAEEMRRLDQMEAAGVSADVVARGRAAAIATAERGIGEVPAGQAALMEGSAAAASAILKAQREQQRIDPMARIERLNMELLEQQRQTVAAALALNDALRRGDFFRAADWFA